MPTATYYAACGPDNALSTQRNGKPISDVELWTENYNFLGGDLSRQQIPLLCAMHYQQHLRHCNLQPRKRQIWRGGTMLPG